MAGLFVRMRRSAVVLALMFALLPSDTAGGQQGAVYDSVPDAPRPDATYVIYLHGRIIEEKGPRPVDTRFGVYEYRKILDTLASEGAIVIAEQRPSGTDFRKFGARAAGQVRRLIAAGVPPDHITVVGFSKGGAIAIIASAILAEPHVGFVFLGACGNWVTGRDDVDVGGRILSMFETSDDLGTSCVPLFDAARAKGERREIAIGTGAGHGAFYTPRPEWVVPVLDWIHRR